MKPIEEYGMHVAVVGFRNVKINDVEKFLQEIREKRTDVAMQFFDAKFVATWQHLYFAALNALKAFENENNISRSIAMESMVYASAQRQIQKAMNLLGIKPDSSEIAVLVIGEKSESTKSVLPLILKQVRGEHDDTVLELSKRKIVAIRKIFAISNLEMETTMQKDDSEKALTELVIERMALLATQH